MYNTVLTLTKISNLMSVYLRTALNLFSTSVA